LVRLHLRLAIAAAALVAWAGGCAVFTPYRYNVLWENHSGTQVRDVRISYGKFTMTFGPRLWVTEPLTPVVEVRFRTPDGKLHQRDVAISDDIRRNTRLADLMFFIEPDLSVSVHLRSREQRKAEAGTL